MTALWPQDETPAPPLIDTTRPHPARMYNYLLGGKDHFEADRAAAEKVLQLYPAAGRAARANRDWVGRAVRHLSGLGIRQFLDIGTGIPAPGNTHEVAQAVDPAARVVYCDNDPIVLAHARALLTSNPAGATAYIEADLRNPAAILGDPRLHSTFDLTEPIALVLAAVLHFVPDDHTPREVVAALCRALPPGSWLVISHVTADFAPEVDDAIDGAYRPGGIPAQARTHEQIRALFAAAGAELEHPGLVPVGEWRPDPGAAVPDPAQASVYGGIARLIHS